MICPELSILEYNLSGHPKISRVAVASIGDLTYSRSTTQHNGCQSYFPLPQPPCIASRSFGCHAFVHFFNLNTQGWTQQSRFEIARSRPVQSRLSTVGPDLDAIPVEADGSRYAKPNSLQFDDCSYLQCDEARPMCERKKLDSGSYYDDMLI